MSALSLDSYFFFLSIFDITKDHCGLGKGRGGSIANKTNSKLRSGGTGGCGQGEGRG